MNRESVLNLMDRGVLPTAEEQAALGLSGIDLVRRWMDGGHAELQRAAAKEKEQWRSFFSTGGQGSAYDEFCLHGTDEQHALFEVAEQHYPKVVLAHIKSRMERIYRGFSASAVKEAQRALEYKEVALPAGTKVSMSRAN